MEDNRWSVELGRGLGPMELGLERIELLRRMKEADFEVDDEEGDLPNLFVTDHEIILTLTDMEPLRLIQIAIDDERVHFGKREVIGKPLHEIVELLQVQESETVWRTDDEPEDSLPTAPKKRLAPATDDELLDGGTLWIRPLGLGLRLWFGEVSEIYLRLPENTPVEGLGQLTSQQLETSRATSATNRRNRLSSTQPTGRSCLRSLLGLACFGAIAWVIWQGALYQRRWHDSPKAEAVVIAVIPDAPEQIPTDFVVAYRDQNGTARQATLGLADVYVPKEVGDKIEVHFLPEDPDHPLTPARIGDAAFVKFFPWVIGLLAVYLTLLVATSILKRLLKGPTRPQSVV